MAVVSSRQLGRSFSHRFGESPSAQIRVAFTLDGATSTQAILGAGYLHGDAHPEYGYLLCFDGQVTESSAYSAEATYSFETPQVGSAGFEPSPLARPDVWSFSTGGVAVPALIYYSGSGNGTKRALTNTAGEWIEGAMTEESEIRCSISGNRSAFPLATAAAVTNCVNSAAYLGGAVHTWKCAGIAGQQQIEVVNGLEVSYWSVTAELIYRQSGWPLQLPNVGWNYISGGTKKRAYVIDPDSGEKIASANPQPLDSSGNIVTSAPGESNPPTILTRRVHPEVAFSTYFGTPPASLT